MQLNLFATEADEKIHKTFIKDLKRGSGFVDGKKRIHGFFKLDLTKYKTIKLLKDEYGIGGMSTVASGGYRQRHESKGIRIDIPKVGKKQYTWSQVYDAIFMLIEKGHYLDS